MTKTSKDYKKINNRISLRNRNLHREITHESYTFIKKNAKHRGLFLKKELTIYPKNLNTYFSDDDRYLERYRMDYKYWEVYFIDGSISYFLLFLSFFAFILFLLKRYQNPEFGDLIFIAIPLVLFICNLLKIISDLKYKKEQIYDRLKGTITFPGVFWKTNITMSFNKVMFMKHNYRNNISFKGMNPIFWGASFHLSVNKHYSRDSSDELTLLIWYMDKNRPLPNITEFKPYFDIDYERRKKENFPPPLYFSFIATREHSKAQLKERQDFWYDRVILDESKKIITTCILRGLDDIFDMKSRKWFKKSEIENVDGIFYANKNLT